MSLFELASSEQNSSCGNNLKKHINWEVASKYNPSLKTSKVLSQKKNDKSVTFHASVTVKLYANSRGHNNMNLIVSKVKKRKKIFQLSKMFPD